MFSERLWMFCDTPGSESNDAITLTTLDSRTTQPNAEPSSMLEPTSPSQQMNANDNDAVSVPVNVDDIICSAGPRRTVSAPRFGLQLPRGHPLVVAESIELVETVV